MIRTVSVGQAPRGYDVLIGPRLMDRAGERLAPFAPSGRIAVLAARTAAQHHGERLAAALEAGGLAVHMLIEGAEAPPLPELGAGDLIAAFGGGSLSPPPPCLAAALGRGAGLVRLPTTLHAQVECVARADEAQPTRLVLADLDVLATLAPESAAGGYADVMKYALAADARLFGWLEAHGRAVLDLQVPALAHAVARCVELKAEILAGPPQGHGRTELGHGFARALQAEAPALGHAEAVSLGCALAFQLSASLGLCPDDHAERATWNFAAVGLPVRLEEAGAAFSSKALLERLRDGARNLTLTLARGIGEAHVARDLDPAAVHDFLIAQGALP